MRFGSVGSLFRPVAVVVATAAVLVTARAEAGPSGFDRFGETRFDELLQLPQWQEVRGKLTQEAVRVRACLARDCEDAAALSIARIVRKGTALGRLDQLDLVQAAINRRPYLDDSDQFGAEDLWQSPLGFARRGGDCEDFAIAKYFALTLLGFPRSDMRIAVMTDGGGEVHAILLARIASEWLVLDNREEGPRKLKHYGHWTPQYAVTETAGYRYVAAGHASLHGAPAQR